MKEHMAATIGGISVIIVALISSGTQLYLNDKTMNSYHYNLKTNDKFYVKKTNDDKAWSMIDVVTNPIHASPVSPADVGVIEIWNKKEKDYVLSRDVFAGDILWFQIHSFGNRSGIKNVMNQMANIHNRTFDAGTTANIKATVSANDVTEISGNIILFFQDRVKLRYIGYQWNLQEQDSQNITQELPNRQNGSFILQSGVALGNLKIGERSNLLIKFIAEKN